MATALSRMRPVAGPAGWSAPSLDLAPRRSEQLLATARAVLAVTDAAVAVALGRPSVALLLAVPVAVSALSFALLRRDAPRRRLRRVAAAAMGADVVMLVALGFAAGMVGGPEAAVFAGAWLTRTFVLLEGPLRYGMAGAALSAAPAAAVELATGTPAATAVAASVAVAAVTAGAVVTALRRSAAQGRAASIRLEQAFAHAPIGLAVLDLHGTVVHANASLAALVGRGAEQLHGSSFAALVDPGMRAELVRGLTGLRTGADSRWCHELPLRADDGTVTWSLVGLSPIPDPDGGDQRLVAQISDVSEQRATQQALEHEATHDRLTGLPGRHLFVQRLSEALAAADAEAEAGGARGVIAVLFCDLDGFKEVNDRYGHARGDQLLAITARRLAGALRLPTLAARWGGDEFVVLCDVRSPEEVRVIARRLVAAVSQPIADEHLSARISMSVGIALPRAGERDPHRVIDAADAAMYRAKHLAVGWGSGGWVVTDGGESVHVPVA